MVNYREMYFPPDFRYESFQNKFLPFTSCTENVLLEKEKISSPETDIFSLKFSFYSS